MNRPIYGNAATTPNLVADYNQNNPKKADYIKNRPFYDGSTCICDYNETFDYGKINPAVQMNDGITLVKGEHLLFEIIEDGKVSYDEIERFGTDYTGNDFFSFKSGRFYSWVEGTNTIQIQTWEGAKEISVKITRPGEVKQLDEKFIPDNIKYAYESKKIGEAEADADMGTAFVICSEEIKVGDTILVKGYFNDGTTEEYTLEVPETDEGYTKIGTSDGRLGDINLPIPTTITFSCDVKGEVYKLTKKPISEATTELYGIIKEIDEALDRVIEKYGLGELTLEKLLADNPTAIGNYPTMEISAGKYKVLGCVSNEDSTLYTDKDLIIHCALYPVGSSPEYETILSPSQTFTIDTDSVLEYPYIDGDNIGIEVTTYIVKVG